MGLVSVKFSIFLFVSNDSLQVPGGREMLKLCSGVCHSYVEVGAGFNYK